MFAILGGASAILLIAIGAILLPLPVPLGAICMLMGIGIGVSTNPGFRKRVQAIRRANPRLEAVIYRFKDYLPRILRKPIQDSDPKADNNR